MCCPRALDARLRRRITWCICPKQTLGSRNREKCVTGDITQHSKIKLASQWDWSHMNTWSQHCSLTSHCPQTPWSPHRKKTTALLTRGDLHGKLEEGLQTSQQTALNPKLSTKKASKSVKLLSPFTKFQGLSYNLSVRLVQETDN